MNPDEDPSQDAPIVFNKPSIVGNELTYISEAVARGHASAGGEFTQRCSALLNTALGSQDVLLTTSCTDALEMSALLLDIQPGDVVIVPSFTFVTTALAFARAGATIKFADIEAVNLGMDPDSVEALIDDRTRAVVPVHYAGVACDLPGLQSVLPADVDVIEDNAHGLFGEFEGRPLGSFGRFSTLSFHETKNFTCGEGGALVINREHDIERAHILLNKGTNRRQFSLGTVDKYSWVDTGSSFGLSDLLAGHLLAQLERRHEVMARREAVWEGYDELFRDARENGEISTMTLGAGRSCAWHMYYVLLRSLAERTAVIEHLRSRNIHPAFHYVPLHSSAGGRSVGTSDQPPCPVTDDVSGRLLRLPFHNQLGPAEQERVAHGLKAALHAIR